MRMSVGVMFSLVQCRRFASTGPTIVLARKSDVIVCWHPERQFPYEHSQPLKLDAEVTDNNECILRGEYMRELRRKYGRQGPPNWVINQMFSLYRADLRPRPQKLKSSFPWGKEVKDREAL